MFLSAGNNFLDYNSRAFAKVEGKPCTIDTLHNDDCHTLESISPEKREILTLLAKRVPELITGEMRVYYELTIDQLPVGLIAELVKHCTYHRVDEFKSHSGLNFFQALIFSQLLNCDAQSCLHIFLCSSYIWLFHIFTCNLHHLWVL